MSVKHKTSSAKWSLPKTSLCHISNALNERLSKRSEIYQILVPHTWALSEEFSRYCLLTYNFCSFTLISCDFSKKITWMKFQFYILQPEDHFKKPSDNLCLKWKNTLPTFFYHVTGLEKDIQRQKIITSIRKIWCL